jgi:CDP-diacylglycerol--glycerol-3-phosphate 3-phosphatidyltransferase
VGAGLTPAQHPPSPPPSPPPDREEYLREWSRLHGGAGTGGLVGWWVGGAHRLARPLARLGAGPDAVTLLGLLIALAVPVAVGLGGDGPAAGRLLAASGLAAASGVLDSLDGAVAVLTGRASRRGFVLDSVCDRIADGAYCAALWLAGAPGPLAVAAAAVAWLHEYTRARAAAAGMPEIGVVTVAERPTRVIVTVMFLLGAGLSAGASAAWATAGAAAWVVAGTVGAVQLAVTVARRLR